MNIHERPTTLQFQAFCNRYGAMHMAKRKKMAASIGMNLGTFNDYYYGKRGKLIPAPAWILLQITWDALLLAQWQKNRPQHEE